MSHIFISYSRRDIDFAQKIVTALAVNDLDTWIDWKSIPKGEDWEQEIYRGIEEAEAFLFLISPDSVASEMCNKEIAHAVRNGKRILPIFIANVDDREMYGVIQKFLHKEQKEEISRRNFIKCREGMDNFNKAVEEIRTTIHTDYEWLKYHTRLQVKSLEWERTKDNSRFLRGKELREAEEQLAGISGNEDPQPNKIQREYVLASRRYEDVQRRRLTFALGTLVLFALLAALIAVLQARQARANQLVAEARTAIGQQNYHLAGLLALEAEKFSRGTGQGVLAGLPYMGPSIGTVVSGHSEAVTGLGWTLDGRLVSSSKDGTIKIWDIATNNLDRVLGTATSSYLSMAISPQGLLASGNSDGIIEIWNVTTGEKITEFHSGTSPIQALAWSRDGQLASGSEDGTVVVWEPEGRQIAEFHEHINKITSVDWGPGDELASASLDGSVMIWDKTNGRREITSDQIGNPVTSFTWVSDNVIATGLENGKIMLWEVAEAKQITILDEHLGPVNSLAVTGDGNIISASGDGRVLIWNMDTGRPLAVFHEYLQQSVNVITSPLDGHLVSGTDDGHIVIWELETGQMMPTLKGHTDSVSTVAWSQNGRLASGSADGSINIWKEKDWSLIRTLYGQFELPGYLRDNDIAANIFLGNGVTTVAWSKDNQLASGLDDGRVIVWSQQPEIPDVLLNAHTTEVVRVAWSVENQLASASEDGEVIVWDLEHRAPRVRFQFREQDEYNFPLTDIAWSPDGRRIIAVKGSSLPPEFMEWDVDTGNLQKVNPISASPFQYRIKMIDWSVTGRMAAAVDDVLRSPLEFEYDENYNLIYIGTYADDVLMWNDFPGPPAPLGRVHRKPVSAVAWSTDGRRFATGSENGDVVIWYAKGDGPLLLPAAGLLPDSKGGYLRDEGTGQPLFGDGHSGGVTSLAWSPDGQLASSSTDGTIIIWDEASQTPAVRLKNPGGAVNSIDWSADGQLSSGSSDGEVIIWDLKSRQPFKTFDSRPDAVKATDSDIVDIAWHQDDEIAASLENGVVIVWDGKTYEQISPSAMGHEDVNGLDTVFSLAWSPDGQLTTAANTLYSNIILWDKNTWEPIIRIPGSIENDLSTGLFLYDITNVVWSPKGDLITAEEDGTIIVWDANQQKPNRIFESKDNKRDFNVQHGFHIAVSPDNLIASSGIGGYVEIWDLTSGKRVKQLPAHQAGVTSLTWSPDNRLTISYRNGQIVVWDENFSHPDTILQGHLSGVNEVAWSSDGHLASAGEDHFVRILPHSLTVPTCEWLARNFSQEEWEQYFSTSLLGGLGIDLVYVPGYKKTCSALPVPNEAKLGFSIAGDSLGLLVFIIILVLLISGITIFLIYRRSSKSRSVLSVANN